MAGKKTLAKRNMAGKKKYGHKIRRIRLKSEERGVRETRAHGRWGTTTPLWNVDL